MYNRRQRDSNCKLLALRPARILFQDNLCFVCMPTTSLSSSSGNNIYSRRLLVFLQILHVRPSFKSGCQWSSLPPSSPSVKALSLFFGELYQAGRLRSSSALGMIAVASSTYGRTFYLYLCEAGIRNSWCSHLPIPG